MSFVARFLASIFFFAAIAFSGLASAHPSGSPHVHTPDQPQGETPVIEQSAEDTRG